MALKLHDTARVWMTGIPGSRWSGVYNRLVTLTNYFDRSDETLENIHFHKNAKATILRHPDTEKFLGHKGTYWSQTSGTEHWEDITKLSREEIVSDLSTVYTGDNTPIIRNHCFLRHNSIEFLAKTFPDDILMMVWRPAKTSLSWWTDIMEWDDTYPDYSKIYSYDTFSASVQDEGQYMADIAIMNDIMFEKHDIHWYEKYFDSLDNLDNGVHPLFILNDNGIDRYHTFPDMRIAVARLSDISTFYSDNMKGVG
jgi:hypothetical protein